MLRAGKFNIFGFSILATGLSVCLLLGLLLPAYAGDPFGFTGSWNYREIGGDVAASSAFSHNYNLTYSKELSQFMGLSASVRYNENQPSDGSTTSSISPTFSLDTRNDLFFINFGASKNKLMREDASSTTNDTLSTTFYTLVEDVPVVRLFYTTSKNYDDSTPRSLDTKSNTYGGGIEYGVFDFDMLYDYRNSNNEEYVRGSSNENIEHLAQLKYSRGFLNNRLSISASQQYQRNENTISIGGGQPLPLLILQAFSGVDISPEFGLPAENPGLINGTASVNITKIDDQTVAGEVASTDGSALQIDVIRLEVIQPEDVLNNRNFFENSNNWEVYRSDNGVNWTEVFNFFPSVSNRGEFVSFNFDLAPITQRYVKIVSKISEAPLANLLPVVNVTRIEAVSNRAATAPRQTVRSSLTNQQTEFSVSIHPSAEWQASYGMRYSKSEQANGLESTKLNQAVNVSYFLTDRLTVAMGVSENTDTTNGLAEKKTRNYSMSVNSELLPSLDMSLAYTHTETTGGERDDITSDSINALLNAIFYPGLTANLTSSWRRMQRQNGSEATVVGLSLNSNARLSPKLDMNLVASYFVTENKDAIADLERDDSSSRYGVNANYRPSDILLLSGSFSQNLDDYQSLLTGNATVMATEKIQLLFGTAFEFGENWSERYSTTFSWLLSQVMSFQTSGIVVSTEEADNWSLRSSLSANF